MSKKTKLNQPFCNLKGGMKVKYGIAGCESEVEEQAMFMQAGKYMLVGWADLNSDYKMPVWRKVG